MFHTNARGGVLMDILHCDTTFIENLAGSDRELYWDHEKLPKRWLPIRKIK